MTAGKINVGLIGYGLAGATFHAPLIFSVDRFQLRAIATSRPVAITGQELRVTPDAQAILEADDIDMVVIATPNELHFPTAQAALDAGKHVVVDKPFTLDVGQATALIAQAQERDRLLSVFHNRRWDGDYLTVRRLVTDGRLGEISLFEARWDRFRPAIKRGWREVPAQGAGLLNDLGPHLVDQALQLFGLPDAISGDVTAQRPGAAVDDYFELVLHYGRMRAILSASTLVAAPRPRFALHGSKGSFVKFGIDPQEAALKAGITPGTSGFGRDDPSRYGTLTDAEGRSQAVATEEGRYTAFYEAVADAILLRQPVPVDPADARTGLRIIEIARQSAREGRRLPLD
ncbi:MAG: oxidoreductase [Pseudomonadota bacterium]|nr:oxidoreductase [Pseudomonadota bacterium]